MGWSRNLGTVSDGDIFDKAHAATTVTTADLAAKRFVETPQLDPREQETLSQAVAMARAGLEQLGGVADVHIGGQVRTEPDGSVQQSITATVTVTISPKK